MIKLDLENLLFPVSFLKIKYDYTAKTAIESLRKKYFSKEI